MGRDREGGQTDRTPAADRPPSRLEYGSFYIVLAGILVAAIAYLVSVLSFGRIFTESSQVLAALTALFGVIGTLVGTYFGVKSSSDARVGAERLASSGDTTPPTIAIAAPLDGGTYASGESVTAVYNCQDEPGGSGMKSCSGTVPSGSPIDTSAPGTYIFTVDAEDNAGNKNSVTHTYTVT